jgi:hypothetical protein
MPDGGDWWNPIDDAKTLVSDAGTALHSAEDWAAHVVTQGIPWFPQIGFFVRLFLDAGLDPLDSFWRLFNRINSRGGDFVSIMEALAAGIQQHGGPVQLLQHLLSVALDPIPVAATQTARALMSLAEEHEAAFAGIDRFLAQFPGFAPPTAGMGMGTAGTPTPVETHMAAEVSGQGQPQVSSGAFQSSFNLSYGQARRNVALLTAPLLSTSSLNAKNAAAVLGQKAQADDGYQPSFEEITNDFLNEWNAQFDRVRWGFYAFAILDVLVLTGEIAIDVPITAVSVGTLTIPAAAVETGIDLLVGGLELEFLGLLPILIKYFVRLIGLLIYSIQHAIAAATTSTTTHHYAPALPLPKGKTQEDLENLVKEWVRAGVTTISAAYTMYHYISWMLCHQYSPDDIAALGRVFNALDDAAPQAVTIEDVFAQAIGGSLSARVGMTRILKAILLLGPQTIAAIDLNYTGVLGATDADIITRRGDVYEVGGSSKGGSSATGIDTGHYSRQLMQAKILAAGMNGTAYTMLEVPSNPSQQIYFDQAVATANLVLGPGHVRPLPPDLHASICPGVVP